MIRFATATLALILSMTVSTARAAEPVVVVELYTSQGCSSCPPADKLLAELASRKDVLPLALHVDYWDYIGWADVFADPAYTKRQRAYARVAGSRSIYTPQMIVGGKDHVIGFKPMAVAGVMGGEHSGITDDTSDVLLESASFRPSAIRSTSKKLGMLSESSYRFMRGVDVPLADFGSRRAAKLMCELAGATLFAGSVDVWPEPKSTWTVTCRPARLEALLGIPATPEEIAAVFTSLDLKVLRSDAELIEVEVPTFREDLTREADLIEEYVRIYGLKRLPPTRPMATIVPDADDKPAQAQNRLREVLAGLGLQQVMNYSFLGEGLLDLFDKDNTPNRVKLA